MFIFEWKIYEKSKKEAKNRVQYSNFARSCHQLPPENVLTNLSWSNSLLHSVFKHTNQLKPFFQWKGEKNWGFYAFPENWPFPLAVWNRKCGISEFGNVVSERKRSKYTEFDIFSSITTCFQVENSHFLKKCPWKMAIFFFEIDFSLGKSIFQKFSMFPSCRAPSKIPGYRFWRYSRANSQSGTMSKLHVPKKPFVTLTIGWMSCRCICNKHWSSYKLNSEEIESVHAPVRYTHWTWVIQSNQLSPFFH